MVQLKKGHCDFVKYDASSSSSKSDKSGTSKSSYSGSAKSSKSSTKLSCPDGSSDEGEGYFQWRMLRRVAPVDSVVDSPTLLLVNLSEALSPKLCTGRKEFS